jgi:hypothetical protein
VPRVRELDRAIWCGLQRTEGRMIDVELRDSILALGSALGRFHTDLLQVAVAINALPVVSRDEAPCAAVRRMFPMAACAAGDGLRRFVR